MVSEPLCNRAGPCPAQSCNPAAGAALTQPEPFENCRLSACFSGLGRLLHVLYSQASAQPLSLLNMCCIAIEKQDILQNTFVLFFY